jgi:hypothetical protein
MTKYVSALERLIFRCFSVKLWKQKPSWIIEVMIGTMVKLRNNFLFNYSCCTVYCVGGQNADREPRAIIFD